MLQSQCFNYYFTLNRINLQAFSNINVLIKQKFTEFRNHNLTNQRVANLKFDFILSWSHITCRHLQHCISAIMRLPSKRIEKWQPKAIMSEFRLRRIDHKYTLYQIEVLYTQVLIFAKLCGIYQFNPKITSKYYVLQQHQWK